MTPAAIEQRRKAGMMKGKRKRNLLGEENNFEPDLNYLPERVKRALEEYKHGLPVESWQDAKAQQGTIAEALANEARLVDLEMQRGKLFSLEEIKKRDEAHDELFITALNDLANWAAKSVPVDMMNSFRRAALDKVAEIRSNISAELGRKK
jgi:hypothetical protein